jgi:cell division protein FtsB
MTKPNGTLTQWAVGLVLAALVFGFGYAFVLAEERLDKVEAKAEQTAKENAQKEATLAELNVKVENLSKKIDSLEEKLDYLIKLEIRKGRPR